MCHVWIFYLLAGVADKAHTELDYPREMLLTQGVNKDRKLVWVCAWCPDKEEQDASARAHGFDVTHGMCPTCLEKNYPAPEEKTMTIVQVNQGMLQDISGYTVGEAKGIFAAVEIDLDKKAEARGSKRTKGSPWLRVFEASSEPRCPWGHDQYVADDEGILGARATNWDSSGQGLIEYAVLAGFVSLVCVGCVIAFGLAVGG